MRQDAMPSTQPTRSVVRGGYTGGTLPTRPNLSEMLDIAREVGALLDELAQLGVKPVGYRLASPYGHGQHTFLPR